MQPQTPHPHDLRVDNDNVDDQVPTEVDDDDAVAQCSTEVGRTVDHVCAAPDPEGPT